MSSGRRAVMAALAAALLVMTTGCGSEGSSSPKATATSDSLMEFTSPAIGGGTVNGAALAGRATLLWFWAPW